MDASDRVNFAFRSALAPTFNPDMLLGICYHD